MKRIAYYVIAMHLLFVLWSALWMPSKKGDKKPLQVRTVVHAPPPKPTVQSVVKADVQKAASSSPLVEPKPTPVAQKPAPSKPTPVAQKPAPLKPTPVATQKTAPAKTTSATKKQPVASSNPAKKPTAVVQSGPAVPEDLVRQLQESIAKIDQKSHKDSPKEVLQASNLPTPKWVPQLKIDEEYSGEESAFVASLVLHLQTMLDLPEFGEVKVELVLKRDGSFVKMKVLHSKSEKNKRFLEQELKTMTFPPFSGDLKNEKEHTFVITFCNS